MLIDDRGPAKYFHGRKRELGMFRELLREAEGREGWSGTCVLVQGPPGVGKTALLAECIKRAGMYGWSFAKIHPGALWDTALLKECLGEGKLGLIKRAKAGLIIPPLAGSVEMDFDKKANSPIKTITGGKTPLLLVLDEAQHLGEKTIVSTEVHKDVFAILDHIHNGNMGRPVVLLLGGLGMTSRALSSLGLSRFKGGTKIELGVLSEETECLILYDWLKKDGSGEGTPWDWIKSIMEKTHGWPQHIMSYATPAARQLEKDGRIFTSEGIESVIETGTAYRQAYYRERMRGIIPEYRESLVKLFLHYAPKKSLTEKTIKAFLSREYPTDEVNLIFDISLGKGVLYEQDDTYSIPIPSMWGWMVKNHSPQQSIPPPEHSQNTELERD